MKYVVKKGDTLSKIAEQVYGDANRWREIFEANRDQIENPGLIRAGWELQIPGAGDEEKPAPPAAEGEKPVAGTGDQKKEPEEKARPLKGSAYEDRVSKDSAA